MLLEKVNHSMKAMKSIKAFNFSDYSNDRTLYKNFFINNFGPRYKMGASIYKFRNCITHLYHFI